MPAPQPSEGAGNVQPVQIAHSTRLHSHVLPQPPQQGKRPQGLLQRGSNCGKSSWPGPLGLEQDRAAPPNWETAPGKTRGGPLAPGQTRHTPASLPACPSHTTGVPGPLCCPGAAEAWLAPVSVPVQAWVAAPRQGPVSFLSSLIRQDSRWSATREGAHGGTRPSLRRCPHISAEEGGGARPELSAGPTPAGGSRPGASLSSLPHGARPAQPWASGFGHGACWSQPACASLDVGGSGTSLGWAVRRYLTSRMDGLVSMMATTILSM